MFGGHLHPLVYIVADKPAKENVSPRVPLVGTQSYRMLLRWVGEMDLDITRIRMYNQSDKPFDAFMSKLSLNRAVELNQIKVIALGNAAAEYLNTAGITSFYQLPHPSGLNRQLNDLRQLKKTLKECKEYVYQKEESVETQNPIKDPAEQSTEGSDQV
jgi:hypothetical protein